MRFEDHNWMEVENYLQNDDRLIWVLGACEQHAYLSLLTDTKIPLALADAAAHKTGILIAPPLNFGVSTYFVTYPGTISLRISTFMDVVEDMVVSAYHQGFRRMLFLNGHGGNIPVQARLYELVNKFPELRIVWYSWWQSSSVQAVAKKHDLPPAHANWLEAFPFTRVVEIKEDLPPKPFIPKTELLDAKRFRERFGDGSFGGPYLAPDSVMNELFQTALEEILEMLTFENS